MSGKVALLRVMCDEPKPTYQEGGREGGGVGKGMNGYWHNRILREK